MHSESFGAFPTFPLSYPQQSIWLLEKTNPDSGIGNIAATMLIDEAVDYDLISRSVNIMLQRNEGFRLRLREIDGEVCQYVAPFTNYKLDFFDFSTQAQEARYAFEQEQAQKPFVMLDQPLFYFALLKIEPEGYGFFVRIHHVIADAWSLVDLGNEVIRYYNLLQKDEPLPEGVNPSYTDFLAREEDYLRSQRFAADQAFWREKLKMLPEPTQLKSSAETRSGMRAERKGFSLPDKLNRKIKQHCQENRTSVFALFFAALALYLNRVRGLDDIMIGTPVLNRTNMKDKKTIGMFINTVPLRIQVDSQRSFVDLSRAIDREWFSVLRHQKYPYDLLIKEARAHDSTVNKLFHIAISYQNAKFDQEAGRTKTRARWHFNNRQVESLYIHINDREDSGSLILNYDYQTDLFYSREIDFIHAHLIQLLWHALDNPTRQLAKIHMLSQQEWDKVVLDFNKTDAEYPRAETLVTLFERQAAQTPTATALIFSDRSMSYAELNARANALAEKLKVVGVGREVIVAMLLERSPTMLVAILAILKAGGAYMPIDPDYPSKQIDYMLRDSQSRHLILDSALPADIDFDGTLVEVSTQEDEVRTEAANPVPVNQPEDLAYIIYTSGSTGDPKGTMIEHRNVVRLIFNDRTPFDFSPQDTWTLFHSYCFDFSVWEMYGALLTGGRLVIVPKLTSRDPQAFLALLAFHQVTILNQTPSAFYQLIEAEKQLEVDRLKLRMVIFGGEALKPILLKPFRQRHPTVRLINMYGITETTVHVTYLEIEDDHIEKNSGNVGRPIPTTTIYILDSHLNPLPIGVAGEICVGGAGVGRGYLGKPELTASRFIPNPFKEGDRLYRSGDQARYYAQGDLEYIGRIDNQVKIRGHRIELGEVEFKLLLHPAVREAVVLPQTSSAGNLQLYAWYVADQPIDAGQLADFLASRMPLHMLPACFIRVEQMPLTSNGKVDRRKLPEPDQDSFVRTPYEAARNEFEAKMVRIWEEILKLERISINDNFFQIGGDSLSAVTAIAMIGEGVTFTDLYQHPTIKSLSESIKKKQDPAADRYLIRLGGPETGSGSNLVCFPYGGGNGPIYRELAEALTQIHADCCVYSLNLPGHDLGSQQALRRLSDLAHDLSREIRETVTGEIIFYGHCVGSALALATARELEQFGRPVRQICVGGILPPRRQILFLRLTDPWRLVSDRCVLKLLGWIGLPVVQIPEQQQQAILAAFRHDVREFYRYFQRCRQQASPKISAPLCCIFGKKDVITLNYRFSHKRWMRYADEVQMREIAQAGHYFMKSHDSQLAGILAGYL